MSQHTRYILEDWKDQDRPDNLKCQINGTLTCFKYAPCRTT